MEESNQKNSIEMEATTRAWESATAGLTMATSSGLGGALHSDLGGRLNDDMVKQ